MQLRKHFFIFILALFVLSGCAKPEAEERLFLKPVGFHELPGWGSDRYSEAFIAFEKSCKKTSNYSSNEALSPELHRANQEKSLEIKKGDLKVACEALPEKHQDNQIYKDYFEQWFTPYLAYSSNNKDGLFTGYYEASLNGSLEQDHPYNYPLLKRPEDLVMVDLGLFREDLKGRRIAGRVKGSYLKPYENREQISSGALTNKDLELLWVDDPVDAFFLHIQGSGVVVLNDGRKVRVGYDGQNGHPYYAIGRELIKQDIYSKEEMSMQNIREYLNNNPDKRDSLLNLNGSYIFFKIIEADGPLGAQGVELTPGRSLAVDRTKIPYGLPVWTDIEPVFDNNKNIRRLLITQDTGGAIRGAVRGDVFWGYGSQAELLAGHMKSKGQYWLLLPKRSNLFN
jgi:membrane-bound lytic murein transglycosylase A